LQEEKETTEDLKKRLQGLREQRLVWVQQYNSNRRRGCKAWGRKIF
jgi:hypothetical protein